MPLHVLDSHNAVSLVSFLLRFKWLLGSDKFGQLCDAAKELVLPFAAILDHATIGVVIARVKVRGPDIHAFQKRTKISMKSAVLFSFFTRSAATVSSQNTLRTSLTFFLCIASGAAAVEQSRDCLNSCPASA